MREFLDYLDDIAEAINTIEKFTKELNYYSFTKDLKTCYAVVRAFEIIGKAGTKIPDSIKNKYSEILWLEIAGMRNKLIHEYFGIDYSIVWKTIKKDLPVLKKQINKIIEDYSNKS